MNRILRTFGVAIGMVVGFPGAGHTQTTMCRPPEAITTIVRDHIVDIVTSGADSVVAIRELLSLPSLADSDVTIVADSSICSAAAAAYATTGTTETSPPVYPVWVIRVGPTRYAVFNPEQSSGLNTFDVAILDDQFNYIVSFVT